MSLFIFLLSGLSASSFFLDDYLTNLIAKNKHSQAQLSFAIEHENLMALNHALNSSEFHSEQWLSLAKVLAKTQGEAAYQLALYYKASPQKMIFWFKSASRLGFHQATLALAQHFFDQNDFASAEKILLSFSANNLSINTKLHTRLQTKLLILKLNLAISQGQVGYIENSLLHDTQLLKETVEGRVLLNDIKKYQIGKLTNEALDTSKMIQQCENSIQLFATSLSHLKKLEGIIADFNTQPLSRAVCFASVRYMPVHALDCTKRQQAAIRCDESLWAPYANSIQTRYVGVMLPQGGANVHFGMLYFDSQDTVDVVAHEISHLLGFVDEYPLQAEHNTCQVTQTKSFSQNIAVLENTYYGDRRTIRSKILKQLAWGKYIKDNTPILQSVTASNGKRNWQLGTPEEFNNEVGVFNAQTCKKTNAKMREDFSAYKGLAQRTQLQYFSLSFPPLYSLLLKENTTHYRMPSFHYNIALAYFQQSAIGNNVSEDVALQRIAQHKKNIKLANYWLEQSARWESERDRYNKVRQGGF